MEVALHHSPLAGDSTVAIALRAHATEPVTGLQADLTFDHRRLRYEGLQVATAPSALVAAHLVAPGRLRVVAAAAELARGLSADAVVLRFAVTSAEAVGTLRIDAEAAAAQAIIGLADARPIRVRSMVPTLDDAVVVGAVESLDATAWTARLQRGPDVALDFLPSGRVYGEPNGSGTLSVGDAVLTANYTVGNLVPSGTQFEAVNVAPSNLADGVEVALPDPCRPGRTCTTVAPFSETGPGAISVGDLVLILNATVGNPVAVVGKSIPAPAGRLSGVISSPQLGPESPRDCRRLRPVRGWSHAQAPPVQS